MLLRVSQSVARRGSAKALVSAPTRQTSGFQPFASSWTVRTSGPEPVLRRHLALPARPEPVRVRLPEDDTQGVKPRSIPKWFKKEGDAVKAGEPLCEVDAGDVVYDFNSPVTGVLVRITAKEGSADLKGGEVIAFLAGSQNEVTSVAYEAAKEIAEHKVLEHGVPPVEEPKIDLDEVSGWLKKIGGNEELLEYIPAFKNEGFNTIEALKTLEEADLDALKISKRGHRKLILQGVSALKSSSGSEASPSST